MTLHLTWPDFVVVAVAVYWCWKATRLLRYKGSWADFERAGGPTLPPGEAAAGSLLFGVCTLAAGYLFGRVT